MFFNFEKITSNFTIPEYANRARVKSNPSNHHPHLPLCNTEHAVHLSHTSGNSHHRLWIFVNDDNSLTVI